MMRKSRDNLSETIV